MKYVTQAENETLDLICHHYYGEESGSTERVLAANPGLADHDVHLPAGVEIELPELATEPVLVAETVQLWS